MGGSGRLKRYKYTPRRSGGGRPIARETTRQFAVFPVLIPIALVALVIVSALWLSHGSGSSCGSPCDQVSGVVTTTRAPTGTPTVAGAAASPQPTPFHSPEPTPTITGLSATILDEPCGQKVYAVNEHMRYPPASLAKLMTTLVAAKNADLSEQITSPIDGGELSLATDGTVMGIALGEKLSLRDLLYGLLLRSGNDAALVIAQAIGGSEAGFVQMMNAEASSLGLVDTNFTNPHGLDDPHLYTSAFDIARIGHEVLQQPALAEIVSTRTYTPAWDKGPLDNINLFLTQYPGAIGLKTGYTDTADQTIVAAATRNGRTLLVSVLHSEDEYVDAGALLDWAFENTAPVCTG